MTGVIVTDTAAAAPGSALSEGEAVRRIVRGPRESQRDYRVLVDVLGRPGEIGRLSTPERVPAVLAAAAGVCDVEVDAAVLDLPGGMWDTPFFLATGAVPVATERAGLIIAIRPLTVADIRVFERGDVLNPERGARVFAAVQGFGEISQDSVIHARSQLVLSGPGIPGTRGLRVDGVDGEVFRAIAEANADFPVGIDLFLVDPDGRVVGLPRSTRIEVQNLPDLEGER